MTRLSDEARDALETLYAATSFDMATRQALVTSSTLRRRVQIWFQNKRSDANEEQRSGGGAAPRRERRSSAQQRGFEHPLTGHLYQFVRAPLMVRQVDCKADGWKQHGGPMDALDVLAYAASVMSETDGSSASTSDADGSDAEQTSSP